MCVDLEIYILSRDITPKQQYHEFKEAYRNRERMENTYKTRENKKPAITSVANRCWPQKVQQPRQKKRVSAGGPSQQAHLDADYKYDGRQKKKKNYKSRKP